MHSRRTAMKVLGGLGVGTALVRCGTPPHGLDGGPTGGGAGGTVGGGVGGSGGGAAGASTMGGGAAGGAPARWATGPGAFLDGKNYGDPFTDGVGPTCTVFPATTKGPCHAYSFDRREMSEGLLGLPTRLELLLLDTACRPVSGAKVDVWHASGGGVYSAAPVFGYTAPQLSVGFCTSGEAAARSAGWFRAFQSSDAAGRVTFDTVFPGWYPGRTWHIHFTVSVGATEYVTSQLFADDALTNEVYNTHPAYAGRPTSAAGYTTNVRDGVVSQAGLPLSEVTMRHARQADGALVMWKAITVR